MIFDSRSFSSDPRIEMDAALLLYALAKNSMWPNPVSDNPEGNIGSSIDNPIKIDLVYDYVKTEYLVADYLLLPKKHRFLSQFLCEKDGRYYDMLTYEVTEKNGTTHEERFYFDITEGHNAPKPTLY